MSLVLSSYVARSFVIFFSSRRRHTRCALVTGVQTCALPISSPDRTEPSPFWRDRRRQQQVRSRAGYLGELGVGFRPLPQTPPMCRWRSSFGRGFACEKAMDPDTFGRRRGRRSEEHTSELQSLMRISYAVFCLKKKKKQHYKH